MPRMMCWLLSCVLLSWGAPLFASEWVGVVRLRAKLSAQSRQGAEDLIEFYDQLLANTELNATLRSRFSGQREQLLLGFESSYGVVYLDEIGRHFLITGASISVFGDFADAQMWQNNRWQNLGEAYILHRDRNSDVAVYLLHDDARPLTTSAPLRQNEVLSDELLELFSANQEQPMAALPLNELLIGDFAAYGSPLRDAEGNIVALMAYGQRAIMASELQAGLTAAIRQRPRATQGALERASLAFVNAMMSEDFDAFSDVFSADILSGLSLPLFLQLLANTNTSTRNNYIFALFQDDLHVLLSTILGSFVLERLHVADQPIIEQIRLDAPPRNPAQVESMATYNVNQVLYSIGWIYSAGAWRMSNLSSFNFIQKRSVFRPIARNGLQIGLGYSFLPKVHDVQNIHASLGYYWQISPFFGTILELNYHNILYRSRALKEHERAMVLNGLLKVQGQFGLAFTSFNIMMFGGFSFGAGIRLSGKFSEPAYQRLLAHHSPVVMVFGWHAGLELGFGEEPLLFWGLEGGAIIDYFSGKHLKMNFDKRSYANGHYLKIYMKIKFG